MSTPQQNTAISSTPSNLRGWFESLIDDIKVDQLMMETSTAPAHKKEFYTAASNGDEQKLASMTRTMSSMYFVKNLLKEYFESLVKGQKMPPVLAMSLSDSKILVWAQIEDEDYDMESALLLCEARANASCFNEGFYISSTIVEKRDNLPVPTDYSIVPVHK